MPGAEIMIQRHHESAAGRDAGRTPDRAQQSERPTHNPLPDRVPDHTAGLRCACKELTRDLRAYVTERIGST